MRSGEVEKWRMAEWRSGGLPICMVLTLISISRRIDSDDSIGVKLLLYSSVCCRVYQYSEAGSNVFGGQGAGGGAVVCGFLEKINWKK
jgi:hypothetical protein